MQGSLPFLAVDNDSVGPLVVIQFGLDHDSVGFAGRGAETKVKSSADLAPCRMIVSTVVPMVLLENKGKNLHIRGRISYPVKTPW